MAVFAGNSEAAVFSDAEKDAQKWIQNRPKIVPKSFKIEVWMGTGQLLGASGLQEASPKSTKNLAKIFQNRSLKGYWAALGCFWATGGLLKIEQNFMQNLPKYAETSSHTDVLWPVTEIVAETLCQQID